MDDRNHPVLIGLACLVSYTAVRYYAGAYLARTRGPEGTARFFRHAAAMILCGICVFAAVFVAALFVSYASMNAAMVVALLGLVAAGFMVVPR